MGSWQDEFDGPPQTLSNRDARPVRRYARLPVNESRAPPAKRRTPPAAEQRLELASRHPRRKAPSSRADPDVMSGAPSLQGDKRARTNTNRISRGRRLHRRLPRRLSVGPPRASDRVPRRNQSPGTRRMTTRRHLHSGGRFVRELQTPGSDAEATDRARRRARESSPALGAGLERRGMCGRGGDRTHGSRRASIL